MAGISTLSGSFQATIQWNASNNVTGTDYQPISNPGAIRKSQSFSNGVANNLLSGADEMISYLFTIAAAGSATIDVTAIVNVLNQTINLARIKMYCFRLLDVADDSVNGTACSSISWGNAASNGIQLGLSAAATKTIYTGSADMYFDQTTGGFVVDGTHKNVKFLNNDGAVAAAVQISLVGGTT